MVRRDDVLTSPPSTFTIMKYPCTAVVEGLLHVPAPPLPPAASRSFRPHFSIVGAPIDGFCIMVPFFPPALCCDW